MSGPLEIVAAPFTLFTSPVGTAFPLIDATPAVEWVLVGTSGALNYREDGVTVVHNQTTELIRMLGETGPVKALRTEEMLVIRLILADITLEQYKHALNFNVVTDTPASSGVAGHREIDTRMGLDVTCRALLLRGTGASPHLAGSNIQYEVPVAVNIAEPEVVYQKGDPAGLDLEFVALVDPNAASASKRFGVLRAQDEAPLP